MNRLVSYVIVLAMLVTLIAVACTPKTTQQTPAPSAVLASSASPAAQAGLGSAVPSPEDAAWAKVVEAAKKEGRPTLYSANWAGDAVLTMAKAFKSRYGIDVDIIPGKSAEFMERLKTEKRMGKMTADLWEGGVPTYAELLILAGLLAPSGGLPALRDKEAFAYDPGVFSAEGYYYVIGNRLVGLHVNTNLVKPGEEPKAWVDLLDPKWKGMITIPDPVLSTVPSNLAILIDQKRLGQDFVEKLGKQDLKFQSLPPSVAQALARGEAAIGFFSTSHAAPFAAQGAPIRIIDTREGVFIFGSGLAMVKEGPYPNAARLFTNWVLTQEGQDVLSKAIGTVSVRKDVPDYQSPALQLKPQNPVLMTMEATDLVTKVFLEKRYVPLYKPK